MSLSRLIRLEHLPGLLMGLLGLSAVADPPAELEPVGMGLGGFSYWSSSPFANAMLSAHDWIAFGPGEWGGTVHYSGNPQFDANGYPRYLDGEERLRTLMWPFSAGYGSDSPPFFPDRGRTGIGKWVLTWEGDADLRIQGGTYLPAESNGPETGRIVDGRRAYRFEAGDRPGHLVVEAVNPANPVTDIEAWMPDPADPANQTLEGRFWHPAFLAYLADMDLNHLRFMDWGQTNQSPQRDWTDRRLPSFRHQRGVLNRRSPAEGVAWYTDNDGNPVYFGGDRGTGIAFEYMVRLCNATGLDLWICVPHLATDSFVRKLARLIRFGSDGTEPYEGPQADPVFPPLDPDLKVWVEYSNEIWSGGNSFPHGNWAQARAEDEGLSRAAFNARRFCAVWSAFQKVFGGSSRIVRVAAVFTASDDYTIPYLESLKAFGSTVDPAVTPDVVAPTTYFGNGIQDWAYEQANLTRGTEDQWFHTDGDFLSGTATRPVSVPPDDPYWTSPKLQEDLAATFVEWKKRIFSGSTLEGGGPDATGTGGGFPASLDALAFNTFAQFLPIVSYEGGPSLYTDAYNGGDPRDDGITTFMNLLNRQPQFAEIYRIQLNMARSKGLDSNTLFVDTGAWGKYGQWGHLEYPDQPPQDSVKWTTAKDWGEDMASIRDSSSVQGSRPVFETPGNLPDAAYNQPYAEDILVSGGDGTAGPTFTVIGSLLAPGLQLEPVPGDPWRRRLSGAPQRGGWSYLYLRVHDRDGDAAWQVYSLYTTGGPGTLLEADISGPFIGTDGTGVRLHGEDGALRFSVSQGGESNPDGTLNATLASAIADHEYWSFAITPLPGESINLRGARLHLDWIRYRYHAPRGITVFSSIEGFTEGSQVYALAHYPRHGTPAETTFTLPDSAAYANISGPVEFRFYFHGSQYGHQAGILGLRLVEALQPGTYAHWAAAIDWKGYASLPGADANHNGFENRLEYAFDLHPLRSHPRDAYPRFSFNLPLADGRWDAFTLRRNRNAHDITIRLQQSPDLSTWSTVPADGFHAIETVLDPDPDGDGSAEFLRIQLPSSPQRFLRLKVD